MNGWGERWRQQGFECGYAWLEKDSGLMMKGDKVRVIRPVVDGMTMLVEHPEHGQQRLACLALDMPREFKTERGRWLPEHDPRVRNFLLKALADLRAGGKKVQASADPVQRARTERELLWLLERNGWGEASE